MGAQGLKHPTLGYKGRRAYKEGSPRVWYWDDDKRAVPPEDYAELDRLDARKAMKRAGIKPAGPRKKKQTKGDQRCALHALGHTPEQIAEAEGVEIETVLRSMRPSRTKKRGGQ